MVAYLKVRRERGEGEGERDNGEGGMRKSRPLLFIFVAAGSRSGGKFQAKMKFTRSLRASNR